MRAKDIARSALGVQKIVKANFLSVLKQRRRMVCEMSIKKFLLLLLLALHVGPSKADGCNEDYCLTDNYAKSSFDLAKR